MAPTKLPYDRLPTWTLDLKEHRFSEYGQPGFIPTPAYDLLGLSEEQLKEFVDQANNIHWTTRTPDDRQSCCLSRFR